MDRRILISFMSTGLQAILYCILLYITWTLGTMVHEPRSMSISEMVGFGAFVKFSIIAFGIMMLMTNLTITFINSSKWTWRLLTLMAMLYIIYWGRGIDYTPLKTGFFLLTGVAAIYSKIPIDKALNRLIT